MPAPAPRSDTTIDLTVLIPSQRGLERQCCSRPMTRIEVIDAVHHLALDTCAACGGHTWERDGLPLDREGVLDAVRARLAEAPPRGRWAAKRTAAIVAGEQAAARLATQRPSAPARRA